MPCVAAQEWSRWETEFDENRKPWKEMTAVLPALPRDDELLRFDAGGASPHRFYVDGASLSAGEDGVVRYTLVIRTAAGSTNTSFEGIRCETREYKTYAIGFAGDWTRARDPKWRRIEHREVNNHRRVLYSDFFCIGETGPRQPDAIRRLLRYGPER